MAAARDKQRAHRKKKLEAKTSVTLVEPISVESAGSEKALHKIKVSVKTKSALIAGEGRTMGMDID